MLKNAMFYGICDYYRSCKGKGIPLSLMLCVSEYQWSRISISTLALTIVIPRSFYLSNVDIILIHRVWLGAQNRGLMDTSLWWMMERSYGDSAQYMALEICTQYDVMTWKFSFHYWPFVKGICQWLVDSHLKGLLCRDLVFFCCKHQWAVKQTVNLLLIWDAMTVIWSHCKSVGLLCFLLIRHQSFLSRSYFIQLCSLIAWKANFVLWKWIDNKIFMGYI